jgi:hypothetical protein
MMALVAQPRGRAGSNLVHALLARRPAVPSTGRPISWSTAVDRFAHSVHRYHDRVEVVPDRWLRGELQRAGRGLDGTLTLVRARRVTLTSAIGLGLGRSGAAPDRVQATRDVLRAGTLCAQATEAAVSAAVASRHQAHDDVRDALDAVRALVHQIDVLLDRA